jgi:hypothetical protein
LTEARRLNPRKKAKKTGVLAAGWERGTKGSARVRASQPAALAQAATSVTVLGG